MTRNLSTGEAARLLGIQEATLREIVRAGWCEPAGRGRRYAFSFQDLVVLRAARELLERRVPAARIRRALASLVAELPAGRALSGLRIYADGRQVAVSDGRESWQPETGQTLFDFEVDGLARAVDALGAGDAAPAQPGDAASEFERAIGLEDRDPEAAAAAYRRVIEQDPEQIDAHVNLGRLAQEAGDAAEACRLYRAALERTPEDPVLHFNLAIALEDAEGAVAAVAHYERALELDPDFADAHYNLAGLCEQLGHGTRAVRHYHAYKKLTEG